MIITTKTYPSGATVIILEPEEGYKYVTNESVWSIRVILGKNDSITNWHDTNDEPPDPPEPTDPETQELADVIDDAEKMARDLM